MLHEDDEDDHEMQRERAASNAVQAAVSSAEHDDLRGCITIQSTEDDRYDTECFSMDDLAIALEEIYDEQWYANVPFDGGEGVFEADFTGEVADALGAMDFEEFFEKIRPPEGAEKILTSFELVKGLAQSRLLRIEFTEIDQELVEYFAKRPDELRNINPRAFEELMAAIYKNRGYDVTLTRPSKDGGFDLNLLQRNDLGSAMTLVDCKRYAKRKKVGVEVVRGLYGVVEVQGATSGMIVTTSSFTSGAVAFREQQKYRMNLVDFNGIKMFLDDWRK